MSAEGHPEGFTPVRLTAADLPCVSALEAAQGWPTAGSQAQLAATLNDGASVVVGLMAGEALAGYAVVVRLPFEAELQAILVDDTWRGRGLARRLLSTVVAQTRAWSSERLLLEVRAGNAPAIALYRGAGFREDGIRRGYYAPRPDPAQFPPTATPRQAGAAGAAGGDDAREDALLMSLPLAAEEPASG
ncbi:GNAT family N-acetyltransferase [Halomonas tibetensis]|uniref:GNAT family N-acetyltransferase n=1 Tax=Halomonas tibetensis TaxID=2259590 RepID=A0ABV7B5P9_9GAMM